MDRMILWPKYHPGVPMFIELKRPGKKPRPKQAAIAEEWTQRGCIVLPYCDSLEGVERVCNDLIDQVKADYAFTGFGPV
jgi:hypothetical protein